jgi:hypothetical protein
MVHDDHQRGEAAQPVERIISQAPLQNKPDGVRGASDGSPDYCETP